MSWIAFALPFYSAFGGYMSIRWLAEEYEKDRKARTQPPPFPIVFLFFIGCAALWPLILILRDHGVVPQRKNFYLMERQLSVVATENKMLKSDLKLSRASVDAFREINHNYEDTLAAIEPYVDWRTITEELDGKFCETWADALDASHKRSDKRDKVPEGDGYSPTDRWWRAGLMDPEEQ